MSARAPYILLVDDDEDAHFIHKRLIKKQLPDAKVVTFTDGRKALRMLLDIDSETHQDCPTHIWLDLKMPDMDGWSFLDALAVNAGRLICKPRITIVSSSPNPDDKQRAKQASYPVSNFVEKYMSVDQVDTLLSPN